MAVGGGLWGCQPAALESPDDDEAGATLWEDSTKVDTAAKAHTTYALTGLREDQPLEGLLVVGEDATLSGHLSLTDGEYWPLAGWLKGDGRWMASLYDGWQDEVAILTGTMRPNGRTRGYWQPLRAGAARLDLELRPSTTTTPPLPVTSPMRYTRVLADYRQEVTLMPGPVVGQAWASLTVQSPHCSGEMALYAFAWQGAWYAYASEGCLLQLRPTVTGLTVMEQSCGYFHGMSCSFEGEYRLEQPLM